MTIGIRCLLAETEVAARPLAMELDRLNRERRDVEAQMQDGALAEIDAGALDGGFADAYTVCVYRPEWHQGVVGIVAGRLKDRFHRPAIVFAPGGNGELKGSGRSIAGFHLRDALDLVAKRAPGISRNSAATPMAGRCWRGRSGGIRRDVRPSHASSSPPGSSGTPIGRAAGAGELSIELGGTGHGMGPRFSAPVFDDTSGLPSSASSAGATEALLTCAGQRFDVLFSHADPPPRSGRPTAPSQRMERHGIASTRHRVLATGVTPRPSHGSCTPCIALQHPRTGC
jgi:hypothetical protein